MDKIEYPYHLFHKLDKSVTMGLIHDFGLDKNGNADKLVYDIVYDLNHETDKEESGLKVAMYYDYLLETIKFSDNRIVITYEIDFGESAPITSFSKLLNQLGIDEDSFNVNSIIRPDSISEDNSIVYRNATLDNDVINTIDIVYGRSVLYKRPIPNTKKVKTIQSYEYIWVEIDVTNRMLRFIISDNEKNHIEGKFDGTRTQIIKEILPELQSKYVFSVNGDLDERHTLFLLYKHLTSQIEKDYSSKITAEIKDEIEHLVSDVKIQLSIIDKEDIGLCNRIEKIFERNLIKKDFENFVNKQVKDGRVLNVGFTDSIGGSVKAASGGKRRFGDKELSFDLQDSDVYFDIKETIYLVQQLQSITVSWKNADVLVDDSRFSNINVTYSAFDGFYVTHFKGIKVRKEIYNYVLPKFEEFKKRG